MNVICVIGRNASGKDEREAWLPIMHTEQQGWSSTALYSNTTQTHELDKTHDWVVLYFDQDGDEE